KKCLQCDTSYMVCAEYWNITHTCSLLSSDPLTATFIVPRVLPSNLPTFQCSVQLQANITTVEGELTVLLNSAVLPVGSMNSSSSVNFTVPGSLQDGTNQ